MSEKLKPTEGNVRSASRVIKNMATLALEMYHSGQLTAEEAGALYSHGYRSDVVAQEVEADQRCSGVMPLMSETCRRMSMRLKMAPTEDQSET